MPMVLGGKRILGTAGGLLLPGAEGGDRQKTVAPAAGAMDYKLKKPTFAACKYHFRYTIP
jgi:hypothetical protein